MRGVIVDSTVLLDLFTDDARWADWSEAQLTELTAKRVLYINSLKALMSERYDGISTSNSP